MKKIVEKIKNYKFPYKIIKTEEYELLKDIEEDYKYLCDKKDIQPTSIIEETLLCSPLLNFGSRMLLRRLKDYRGE